MKPEAGTSKRKGELLPNIVILIVCSAILGGALVGQVSPLGNSRVRVGGTALPDICMFRAYTGLPCPGCGLTRSLIAAAHGKIRRSFSLHRLGLITLLYVLLQFALNLGYIMIPKSRAPLSRYFKFLHRGIIVLAVLFVLNWILTLILIFS